MNVTAKDSLYLRWNTLEFVLFMPRNWDDKRASLWHRMTGEGLAMHSKDVTD